MTVYWLIFIWVAWMAVTHLQPVEGDQRRHSGAQLGLGTILLLTMVIGFRHQVGGDWANYLEGLEFAAQMGWDELFDARKESGFTLLNWVSLTLGLGIYGVNLICAALFVFGLVKLAKDQPYPWLVLVAATPYLIIVVSMGYTRQAVALGLLMYGLKFLLENKVVKYLALVGLAGLFHKTALIFLAFVLFRPSSGVKIKLLGAGVLAVLISGSIVVEQAQFLMEVYVAQTMESGGGEIRVLMNLPAAAILIMFWKKWGTLYQDRWLWSIFSLLALLSVPMVSVASTAVDRMAIYLIPLQLVAFSRLPELLHGKMKRTLVASLTIVYYGTVQFVWLFFATHAPYWLPYKFYPWEWLWN